MGKYLVLNVGDQVTSSPRSCEYQAPGYRGSGKEPEGKGLGGSEEDEGLGCKRPFFPLAGVQQQGWAGRDMARLSQAEGLGIFRALVLV